MSFPAWYLPEQQICYHHVFWMLRKIKISAAGLLRNSTPAADQRRDTSCMRWFSHGLNLVTCICIVELGNLTTHFPLATKSARYFKSFAKQDTEKMQTWWRTVGRETGESHASNACLRLADIVWPKLLLRDMTNILQVVGRAVVGNVMTCAGSS